MSYPLISKNFLPGMEFPPDVDAALVTFHKKGCPACHKFLPVFDQAALTNPNPDKVLYLTFDLDGATKQMFNGAPFKLTSVPTVMKYEQGKFVEQFENDTGKLPTIDELHGFVKGSKELSSKDFNLKDKKKELMTLKAPNNKKDVVILIYSPSCPHCVHYKPIFDSFSHPRVDFKTLNIQKEQGVSQALNSPNSPFDSPSIPTIVSYHKGKFYSKFGKNGNRNDSKDMKKYADGIGIEPVTYISRQR